MTGYIDRIGGYRSALAWKAPCRASTTANITLNGLQTLDGVALAEGDRVLVRNQTAAAENGIYLASAEAWVRARDFATLDDVARGTRVYVTHGNDGPGDYEVATENPISIGTTSLSILRVNIGGTGTVTETLESLAELDADAGATIYGDGSLWQATSPRVATRTALKAHPTDMGWAYLTETGRKGWFFWNSGVSIVDHQADTEEGFWVAPDSGFAGVWERMTSVLELRQFGAALDSSTDDRDAMSAAKAVQDATGLPLIIDEEATNATEHVVFNKNTIRPTTELSHSSSTFQFDADDDLSTLVPRCPAGATVQLADATLGDPHTFGTCYITKPVLIEALNLGSCFVQGSFDINCGGKVYIRKIDFIPEASKTIFTVDGGCTAVFDDNRATAGTVALPSLGAVLTCWSGNVYMRAVNRITIWDYRTGTGTPTLVVVNYNSTVQFDGLSTYYGWFRGPDVSGWIATATLGKVYFSNFRIDGAGKTGASSGLLLQRGAYGRIYQSSAPGTSTGIQNCVTGLQAGQESRAFVAGAGSSGQDRVYIASCVTGMSTVGGGRIRYQTTNVLLSGNTADTAVDNGTTVGSNHTDLY